MRGWAAIAGALSGAIALSPGLASAQSEKEVDHNAQVWLSLNSTSRFSRSVGRGGRLPHAPRRLPRRAELLLRPLRRALLGEREAHAHARLRAHVAPAVAGRLGDVVEREPHLPSSCSTPAASGRLAVAAARPQRAAVEAGRSSTTRSPARAASSDRVRYLLSLSLPVATVAEAARPRPLRRDPAAVRPQRRPQHVRPEPAVRRHQAGRCRAPGASTSATCRSSSRRRAATSTTSTTPCASSSTGRPTGAAAAATRRPGGASRHELLRDVAPREPRARRSS